MKYYGIFEFGYYEDEIIGRAISNDFKSLKEAYPNCIIYISNDIDFIKIYYDYEDFNKFSKMWKPYDGTIETHGYMYKDKFYSEDEVFCLEGEQDDLAEDIYDADECVLKVDTYKEGILTETKYSKI